MDLQFPNGQLTYVSGEGLTTSAFVPFWGGLLQAQGQYPGDMRFSYSYKVRWRYEPVMISVELILMKRFFNIFVCGTE